MIKVRAKTLVFYGGQRRRVGEEFEIKSKRELSAGMEVIEDETHAEPTKDGKFGPSGERREF